MSVEQTPFASVPDLLATLGVSAIARALGHENASTVSSWKARGRIPVEHWQAVIELGRKRDLAVDADSLLGLHTPSHSPDTPDVAA